MLKKMDIFRNYFYLLLLFVRKLSVVIFELISCLIINKLI